MLFKFFLNGFLCLGTISVYAQNLPNKQEASLRAPVDVKTDGKAIEWNNKFKAYNHATDIFYTMANDDENLYLVVQATMPNVISRIMGGGITLNIKRPDKKNTISITYPIIEHPLYFNLRKKKGEIVDTSVKVADSIMIHNNALLDKNCKWIRVTGITGIDTTISVYNVNGIKALGAFDNQKIYTCEFSVKLKLIDIPVNGGEKFTYQIRLNGTKPIDAVKPSYVTPGYEAQMNAFASGFNQANEQLSSPTDFWGEYTLAKK